MTPLRQTAAWKRLESHHDEVAATHLRQLFAEDPGRGERLRAEGAGLLLDYSKHRVTGETLELLIDLARERGVPERRDAMLSGQKINSTEGRAVLHTALRAPRAASIMVDGHDVVPDVHEVLGRMAAFARRVRDRSWLGGAGDPITNIVNIGIGGIDLGPVMAHEALEHYSDRGLVLRFVSNVDGTDFVEATRDLDPARTLFIVSSKTFTTLETMANAAQRPAVGGRRGGRGGGCPALRRRFHERRAGGGLRHRHRRTCSASGTGWAAATRWTRPSACRP